MHSNVLLVGSRFVMYTKYVQKKKKKLPHRQNGGSHPVGAWTAGHNLNYLYRQLANQRFDMYFLTTQAFS